MGVQLSLGPLCFLVKTKGRPEWKRGSWHGGLRAAGSWVLHQGGEVVCSRGWVGGQ